MSLTVMSVKLKQIVIDESNYQALRKLGQTGDSFNDVITRVLKRVTDQKEVVSK